MGIKFYDRYQTKGKEQTSFSKKQTKNATLILKSHHDGSIFGLFHQEEPERKTGSPTSALWSVKSLISRNVVTHIEISVNQGAGPLARAFGTPCS